MDNDTLISSGNLFHYTATKENLENILRTGFKSNYSFERVPMSLVKGIEALPRDELKYIKPIIAEEYFHLRKSNKTDISFYVPLVSFCDIPLTLTSNHRKIYGNYAIGLSKKWANEIEGLNPVIYLTKNSRLLSYLNILLTRISLIDSAYFFRPPRPGFSLVSYKKRRENDLEQTKFQFKNRQSISLLCQRLHCYFKPYIGHFKHSTYENSNYKFYDEREWRYIPEINNKRDLFLSPTMPNNLKDDFNTLLPKLSFNLSSVTHIIVNFKSEIVEFKNLLAHLQTNRGKKVNLGNIKFKAFEQKASC